jgi:hypothetical protein
MQPWYDTINSIFRKYYNSDIKEDSTFPNSLKRSWLFTFTKANPTPGNTPTGQSPMSSGCWEDYLTGDEYEEA